MIEVKLSFNTQAELVAFFTGRAAQQVIETTAAADIPAEIVKAAEPKKTRTKKAEAEKAEAAPAAVEPAQESTASNTTEELLASPANAEHLAKSLAQARNGEAKERELIEDVSAPSYTVDDVRRALQDYVGRTDFATGTALVKSFGATRITELKAEDYAAFIAATQQKAAA